MHYKTNGCRPRHNTDNFNAKSLGPIKYSSKKFPEMSVLRLNSDKARKKLNWNTQTSLEETIEKVVGWENYYNSSKSSIEFSVLEIKSFISENNIDYEIQKN